MVAVDLVAPDQPYIYIHNNYLYVAYLIKYMPRGSTLPTVSLERTPACYSGRVLQVEEVVPGDGCGGRHRGRTLRILGAKTLTNDQKKGQIVSLSLQRADAFVAGLLFSRRVGGWRRESAIFIADKLITMNCAEQYDVHYCHERGVYIHTYIHNINDTPHTLTFYTLITSALPLTGCPVCRPSDCFAALSACWKRCFFRAVRRT